MSVMYILNQKGDTTITWDAVNEEATKIAEEKFNELRSQGHMMTEVKDGIGQETIDKFNPEAEEIVAVRPIAGG